MNSNPYVLTSVLPRVAGLEPGARIETLELSVGSLYVGTSGMWPKEQIKSSALSIGQIRFQSSINPDPI